MKLSLKSLVILFVIGILKLSTAAGQTQLSILGEYGRTQIGEGDKTAGLGLGGALRFNLSKAFSLGIQSGYLRFEKENNTFFSSATLQLTLIPVLVEGQYVFDLGGFNPYLRLGAGGHMWYTKSSGTVRSGGILLPANTSSETKFDPSLVPAIGVQLKINSSIWFDVSGRYHLVFTEGENSKATSIQFGFTFILGSSSE